MFQVRPLRVKFGHLTLLFGVGVTLPGARSRSEAWKLIRMGTVQQDETSDARRSAPRVLQRNETAERVAHERQRSFHLRLLQDPVKLLNKIIHTPDALRWRAVFHAGTVIRHDPEVLRE